MSISNMVVCFLCVVGVATGQVLMKGLGIAWIQAGTLFDGSVAMWIGCAFFVYCGALLGWVYILKALPLPAAYPFLAMTFLLVSIAGHLFLNKNIGWRDGVTALLIISGICLTSFGRSSS